MYMLKSKSRLHASNAIVEQKSPLLLHSVDEASPARRTDEADSCLSNQSENRRHITCWRKSGVK